MFDLFRQAQGGAAFDNLARAYGMSPDQMRAMAAALTPAFAQGFQRQTRSDGAARRFAELFQTEAYARAFEAQAAALDPAARGAGEDALGALFGNKDVSRAVAQQAAAASGVQAEIIRQVLPVLASILVGGFMKAYSGTVAQPAGGPAFPGPFGEFWSQMGGAGRAAEQKPEAPAPNPFQDWMESFARVGAQPGAPGPANPMGDMMAEMIKAMFGATPPSKPEPEPQPEAPEPEPRAGTGNASRPEGSATVFDDFVETGRELSAQNAKAMEQIFDAFFKTETPKR